MKLLHIQIDTAATLKDQNLNVKYGVIFHEVYRKHIKQSQNKRQQERHTGGHLAGRQVRNIGWLPQLCIWCYGTYLIWFF